MRQLFSFGCVALASVLCFALIGCAPQGGGDDRDDQDDASVVEPLPDPGIVEKAISHHGRIMDIVEYRPDAARFPVIIFSHGYNGYKDDFKSTAEYLLDAARAIGVGLPRRR